GGDIAVHNVDIDAGRRHGAVAVEIADGSDVAFRVADLRPVVRVPRRLVDREVDRVPRGIGRPHALRLYGHLAARRASPAINSGERQRTTRRQLHILDVVNLDELLDLAEVQLRLCRLAPVHIILERRGGEHGERDGGDEADDAAHDTDDGSSLALT